MTSVAEGLFKSLPKPKYTGEDEEVPQHAQPRGPRIVGADQIDQSQIVLRRTGPPPYGNRAGWRPRAAEDFGDGGAFPEILVAQYPLDMGRKGTATTSNALAVQVDAEGKVKYDAIARRGHSENRIVHASFKDLIPLRQRVDMGEISLDRPSEEEVQAQMEKTKNALASLVEGAVAAQKPKNVKGGRRAEPTFVRYTPANQMGDTTRKNDRIMKIVERQQDPMEPPKFKHKKIPRGPPSPPPAHYAFSASKADGRRPGSLADSTSRIELEKSQGLHGPAGQASRCGRTGTTGCYYQRQVRSVCRGPIYCGPTCP
ncbi:mRNA splicing protein [Aspergillus fumigatus]